MVAAFGSAQPGLPARECELDVGERTQMRKERLVLGHVRKAPLFGWAIQGNVAVEQDSVVQYDAAAIRTPKTEE